MHYKLTKSWNLPHACDTGLNELHIHNVKPQLQSNLPVHRTSNAQENTFGVATSSKSEPTKFDTAANSSKYVVDGVHAPVLDTLATNRSDRAVGAMNIQQYCQFPTLQQSHNGLPTN
jgi:hypothetical protein